ncbi:MAG: glycosyltransferase [Prolixibacteraceae bacterium]|nr:glycosyltransferase [Prolixibacteraceae bacterium]
MQNFTINIVAFDIPFPPNYGGTIDIFYKLAALHNKGVHIILHCFEYNKPQQKELEKYCEKIFYYPRKKGLKYIFSKLPYIIITRSSSQLLKNLKKNNFPILFEGLHTCYFLNAKELTNRKKIVRTHNIEHDYYTGLQKASKNSFKKIYYHFESKKLEKYEHILSAADAIISISKDDQKHFSEKFSNVHFIPAFHPFNKIVTKTGSGDYFLYHGNLSVEENITAINFLLEHVFNKTKARLIIAGKNPDKKLMAKAAGIPNVQLIANPDNRQMYELLENAHGCVLPAFQTTGFKLKLLVSLFSSRFVIVNNTMVQNTSLENLCIVANTATDFILAVNKTTDTEFNQKMMDERIAGLRDFSNDSNCDKLIKIISTQ